jgi:hypothetical protein
LDLKGHGFEGSRRARLRLLGHNEGDDARRLEVQGKKTREENKSGTIRKESPPKAVRPQPILQWDLMLYDASLI